MNQKCLDSSAASVEDKKNSSSLPVKRVCLPDQVKNSWRGAGIVCHSCNSFYKTSSRLSSAFIYSLSMEIMSFSSFQIRWVQWNPYFTYLLTRLSSLWYCNLTTVCKEITRRTLKPLGGGMCDHCFSSSYLYSCMLLHQLLFVGLPFHALLMALILFFPVLK